MTVLYDKPQGGGIRFGSDRKPGEVRVPNYIYDMWMPLLGAECVGVYSTICRLEMQGSVKKMSMQTLAKALRIGDKTLVAYLKTMSELGFVSVNKPEGYKRLMHWTTEIIVHDPPRSIPEAVIKQYEPPSGYEPLTPWLVEKPTETLANVSDDVDERSVETLANVSKIATLYNCNPLEIEDISPSAKNADGALPAPALLEVTPLPLEDALAPKTASAAAEPLASVAGVKVVENAALPPGGVLVVAPAAAQRPPAKVGIRFCAKPLPVTEQATDEFYRAIGEPKPNGQYYRWAQRDMRILLCPDKKDDMEGCKTYSLADVIACGKALKECGAKGIRPGMVASTIDSFLADDAVWPEKWVDVKTHRQSKAERDARAYREKAGMEARAMGLIP